MHFDGGIKTICPFYLKESKYRISCEGEKEGTELALVFSTEKEKINWQKEYCYKYDCYQKCTIVKILNLKYKENVN